MENDNGMTLREILKKYGSLSEECLQEFESQAVMESYMRKEVIVPQGKICDSLYFTSQGLTRVAFHRGRKEDTICFGGAGDVFMSFHSLYGSQKAVFSLVAITDLTCYRVSNNSFRMLRQKTLMCSAGLPISSWSSCTALRSFTAGCRWPPPRSVCAVSGTLNQITCGLCRHRSSHALSPSK